MAKRVGCGAHVEQQVHGRVQKPPGGVKNTYTADIAIGDCKWAIATASGSSWSAT